MDVACWVPKATNTHIIFNTFFFVLKRWSLERASILCLRNFHVLLHIISTCIFYASASWMLLSFHDLERQYCIHFSFPNSCYREPKPHRPLVGHSGNMLRMWQTICLHIMTVLISYHFPVSSSPFKPNILLDTLIFIVNLRNHVSETHKI